MGRSSGSVLRSAAMGALLALLALPAAAQQNVADVRAELDLLSRQVQEIRGALVASGPPQGLPQSPATALQRLDQLEEALRRLMGRVDVLTNDVDRAVRDATNRVEDIEWRLTELEGGDPSVLGRGEPLGGGVTQPAIPPVAAIAPSLDPAAPAVAAEPGFPRVIGEPSAGLGAAPAPAPGDAPQLAVGERTDFEAARAALDDGRPGEAVRLFEAFLVAYPVGPFSAEARHLKAEGLAAQGEWRLAARTYLDAFSGAPESGVAPKALHGLGVSLGRLGQTEEACLTLAEVTIRYPGSDILSDVAESRRAIGCR